MCGRYALTASPQQLQMQFNLESAPEGLKASYNIAPSQVNPVITNDDPGHVSMFKWGLIPRWAKDASMGNRLINARAETVAEKPSFREALKYRRCLVPMNGFYEWYKRGNKKVPMYVHGIDHELLALAGLWETWRDPDGQDVHTYTILTTEANELVSPYHHRMAVILDPDQYDIWLSDQQLDQAILGDLLQSYPSERMEAYEVSTMVNSVANNSPELIEPYHAPGQAQLL